MGLHGPLDITWATWAYVGVIGFGHLGAKTRFYGLLGHGPSRARQGGWATQARWAYLGIKGPKLYYGHTWPDGLARQSM